MNECPACKLPLDRSDRFCYIEPGALCETCASDMAILFRSVLGTKSSYDYNSSGIEIDWSDVYLLLKKMQPSIEPKFDPSLFESTVKVQLVDRRLDLIDYRVAALFAPEDTEAE